MFRLFKKKTKLKKLQLKYEALMKEAYKLSRINRTQSDQKYLEAEEILKEIEKQDENKK